MKINGHNRHLYLQEDDDLNGGGVGAPPAPPVAAVEPPKPPVLTQAEIDGREARMRKANDRKIRELEASHTKQLAEIKAQLAARPNAPAPNAAEEGQLEIQQRRHERDMQEMRAQVEALQANSENERKLRMSLERDRLVDDALASAGVTEKNVKAARRYFMPDIEFDDLDQAWMFKNEKGNLLSIHDAVQEYLPDSLKPSKIARGGAGTQGGVPARQASAQRGLDEAKKELAQIEAQVSKRPNDNGLLTQYTRKKQQVRQLESDLKSATK